MDYHGSDSSGTDDDFPPSHRNRFSAGGRASGNGRSAPFPGIHHDMETRIHQIEQEGYISILRAFKAQSDALTWEKESLITELRKELKVSNEEHRELLSKVNDDDVIRSIREWRNSGGPGMLNTSLPLHEVLPSPTISASRKKQKTLQSTGSLSFDAPSLALQTSSSALKRGPPSSGRGKKSKTSLQLPSTGVTGRVPVDGMASDSLLGRKVWTRWPEDNHFYEAVITDYNPLEGRHALVYDINTTDETWEWVNLKEISPEDIKWEGDDPGMPRKGGGRPGTGRGGIKKCMARGGGVSGGGGRGRSHAKSQSKKDFPPPQNGIGGVKASGDIELLHTDTLIKEVEKLFSASETDPMEIEKARKVLKEHEQALVDAIARLEDADASDGESDGERRSMEQDHGNRQYNEMGTEAGNQTAREGEDHMT